jgi:hypothetical protein
MTVATEAERHHSNVLPATDRNFTIHKHMTECHSIPKLAVQRWHDTDFHACRIINVLNNDK